MKARQIQIFCGIAGAIGVGLGAFGAHALEKMLEATGRTDTWDTATYYLFVHVLALLFCSTKIKQQNPTLWLWVVRLFMVGIVVFCGALYTLCLTNTPKLGAVAPIGGLSFISGWVLLAIASFKQQD